MKKILTIVLSAVIVASIAIGGTLAFLTANTSALENVFQFDGIAIGLNEYKTYDPQNSANNVAYPTTAQTVAPGTTVSKIPVITVNANSTACYVYVKVNNALNAAVANSTSLNIDTTNWTEISANSGIYRYNTIVQKATADTALPPVFTTVAFSGTNITMENIATLGGKKITIQAFAHQVGNDENNVPLTTATIDGYATTFFNTP